MTLGLKDKQDIVVEVNEVAQNALSAVVAYYAGLTVDQMTDLRKRARENGVYVRVVRNTLAKRAIEETEFKCLESSLVGPTVLAFSQDDPGAAARLFKDFSKENNKLEVKALSVSGKLLAPEQIDLLATLPTLEQALAQLMSVMNAPVTKLLRTMNEVPTKVTRAVSAVADKKQSDDA